MAAGGRGRGRAGGAAGSSCRVPRPLSSRSGWKEMLGEGSGMGFAPSGMGWSLVLGVRHWLHPCSCMERCCLSVCPSSLLPFAPPSFPPCRISAVPCRVGAVPLHPPALPQHHCRAGTPQPREVVTVPLPSFPPFQTITQMGFEVDVLEGNCPHPQPRAQFLLVPKPAGDRNASPPCMHASP